MADLLTRPATSVDVEPYRDLVLESACTDPKSYLYDVEGLLARPLDAWTKELEQPKRQVILGFSSTEPEKPLGLQRVDISKGSAYMHGL